MGSGEGGTLTNAVLTHRQMFNSGQLKKESHVCISSGVGGRLLRREGSCVNSQDLRNFPSGSIGGEVGLLLCCVCLSSYTDCLLFAQAQEFR